MKTFNVVYNLQWWIKEVEDVTFSKAKQHALIFRSSPYYKLLAAIHLDDRRQLIKGQLENAEKPQPPK